MNRQNNIFLGWETVFKRDIHLKEQRKEFWIGSGAKTFKNREYKNLFGVCGGGGGGGEEGNGDSKCALFYPSGRA